MYILKLKHHFDASHYLLNYNGNCANVHGHTYEVEICLEAKELKNDMVLDFKELKKIVREVIDDNFDHKNLNEVVAYNPTAENLVKDIFGRLKARIPVVLLSVELWEGLGTSIKYQEDDPTLEVLSKV